MLNHIKRLLRALGLLPTADVPSSQDIIPAEDIVYDEAQKTITIKNMEDIRLLPGPSTESMDPLIDAGHTVILTSKPELIDLEKLKVGDEIVWWRGNRVGGAIQVKGVLHRIVKIAKDKNGLYCRTKGDNNAMGDAEKVRQPSIAYRMLGVLR